jgi:hypothetical protein
MINQDVILPQVMTKIGHNPNAYCWGFGIPIRYWRVSREVYFLVRWETPRLCRGGSKSLTAPAVRGT